MAGASSFDETRMPLCVKLGNADLFCFPAFGSSTEVSTRNDPGRPPKPVAGGVVLTLPGLFAPRGSWRFAEMRARREVDPSLGSLSERGRCSPAPCKTPLSWPP